MLLHAKAKLALAITFLALAVLATPVRGVAADYLRISGGYGGYGDAASQDDADGWGALVTTDSSATAPADRPSVVNPIPGIEAVATDGTAGIINGAGGVGGSVAVNFKSNLKIDGNVDFTGGTGGDGDASGLAGAGGSVQVDARNYSFTIGNSFNLAGGDGGTGGSNDGAGGSVTLTNLKNIRVGTASGDDLSLFGGKGSDSAGAQGGSVTLAVNDTLAVVADMYLVGGGDGAGGAGGDVAVTARTVRLGDDLFVASQGSSKTRFSAQSVEFFNGTAATGHTLELNASTGGTLSFSVGELIFDEAVDPGKAPFKLILDSTTAAASRADAEANGGVFIDTITLRNNARLDLTGAGTPGTNYNFRIFRISDAATLQGNATTLDFSGKAVAFTLQKAGGYVAGDTALHIDSTDAMKVSGGTLAFETFDSLWRLQPNEHIILIDKSTGALAKIIAGGKALAHTGEVFQGYDGSGRILSLQVIEDGVGNQHRLGVRGASVRESAKPLALGARAGLSTVTAMQDAALRAFTSPSLLQTPDGVDRNTAGAVQPLAIFGMEASSLQHNVGGRVDTRVATLVAGPGIRFENMLGRTTMGAVFESAWGNYDTSIELALGNTAHTVNGSGNVHSLGGALLLRHDFTSGLYGEASIRAGSVNTRFSSEHSSLGSFGSYEAISSYWGGHVGGGYSRSFGDTTFDVYNKLLWTRQNGFSESVAYPTTTRRLEVDAAESLRNHLGVRVSYGLGAHLNVFGGAAWEYEFNGKVSSRLDGGSIGPNSSQGHSGLGEVGISYQPSDNITLSLSGFGVTGKRTGGGGSVSLCFTW